MKIFWASSQLDPVTKKGKLSFGSADNRARFSDFLTENIGVRFRIDPYTPESSKQRGFFEGAIVPFVTYYQENLDYKDKEDLAKVRHWLKIEFNGQYITLGGRSIKVPKSTKGELNRGFLERIVDWMGGQGYQVELLIPTEYKKWKDEVYPYGGPGNYIEYLLSINKLKPKP